MQENVGSKFLNENVDSKFLNVSSSNKRLHKITKFRMINVAKEGSADAGAMVKSHTPGV